ncbi:SsrA-binding protein SmpB [Candidatus Nomurabacteria bacterium]|nr:SsrA-binding protein SmpB [Candidatus Nomurabacteria bacterium]
MAEYLHNKKATFDYTLWETYECGIELLGTEVKSIKHHHGSLTGGYVAFVDGELYLLGAHIPPWQEGNTQGEYDPYRSRKLLVRKNELVALKKASDTKGLTFIPISLYGKGTLVKMQLAIARGKKVFDKRDVLKKKAVQRDIERALRE